MIVVSLGLPGLIVACVPQDRPLSEPEKLVSLEQTVIGGKPDNSHPAVGAMVTKSAKSSYCTATLIGSRLVLTAAHCASRRTPSSIQFRIDRPNGSGITKTYHDVAQQVVHPQYGRTSRGLVNDLALVILSKDVTGVAPMPVNAQAMDKTWVNRKIFFIGYGLIQTTPQRRKPTNKYSVEITLRRLLSDRFETKDAKKSVCSGDSGGPALYKLNGRMTLIGVNSYVTGRSSGGRPYCDGSSWDFRVDPYNTWLQPYLAKYGGKCTTDQDCGNCFVCEKTSGKCKPKVVVKTTPFCSPCSGTCGNGGVCEALPTGYRCLQACDASRCCPPNSTCQKVGGKDQCMPDKALCPAWKCKVDKDCGPGEVCNQGACKPAPVSPAPTLCGKCTKDTDCKGGRCVTFPEGKYCTQPCANNLFCPTGYTCKSMSGSKQCFPTTGICPCKSNATCYTGFSCTGGRCARQGGGKYGHLCDSRRPCAKGYRCVQQGSVSRCFQTCQGPYPAGSPGAACGGSNGRTCSSGSRCLGLSRIGYICFRLCSNSGSCVNGGTCTRISRTLAYCRCTADNQCKNGATCNRDRVSSLGQCATKSNNVNQCAPGLVCKLSGSSYLCVPGASQRAGEECDATRRCQAGLVCANTERGNSVCIRRCTSDTFCKKEGGSCTLSGNIRFCTCNTAKCSAGYICKDISSRNKVCTPGSCKSDKDCSSGQACNNGTCGQKPAGCQSDSDCSAKQRCRNGKCEAKPACSNDADCGSVKLECQGGVCVPRPSSCLSNKDCTGGQKCENGACRKPAGCASDNECAAKERCDQGKCVPRTTISCTRDDSCPVGQRCISGGCVGPGGENSANTDAAGSEKSSQDGGSGVDKIDQNPPQPPPKGCQCSTPTNPNGGIPVILLLLFLLPLLIQRRYL